MPAPSDLSALDDDRSLAEGTDHGRGGEAIDSINRQILKALHDDARTTYRALSERVGLSINAVRDRVLGMEAEGTIRGYQARIAGRGTKQALLLMKQTGASSPPHPGLWNSLCVQGAYAGPGRYPLVVHLTCPHDDPEAQALVQRLESVGFRAGLVDTIVGAAPAAAAVTPAEEPPDQQDLRLLELLRLDGNATMRRLAQSLDLPETTVRDRVHRLEARGTLLGIRAAINPLALGYTRESWIIAKVSAATRTDLAVRLARHPSVLNVLCSGTYPDRLAIHAIGGPAAPLMDFVDKARVEADLHVLHFLPIEFVLLANIEDRFPGGKKEKEGQEPHLSQKAETARAVDGATTRSR